MNTRHPRLGAWVDEWTALLHPDSVEWTDGSSQEWDRLTTLLVTTGAFTRLDDSHRPNPFLARSEPGDVARVEDRTFICSEHAFDAGPTNNWRDPADMKAEVRALYRGAMRGRTMHVVPFSMGRWAHRSLTSACS